jgi:hypothetical protein
MADPYAPDFDNASANISDQQRGALTALAKGGSQGLAAYKNAISQSGGIKQAALAMAAKRAALLGGPEASAASITNPIVQGGNIAATRLNANSGALQSYFKNASSANDQFFNNANSPANLQANELALQRVLASQGGKGSEADRNAQILGSAQSDLKAAQDADTAAASDFTSKKDALAQQVADAKAQQTDAYAKWAASHKVQGGFRPAPGNLGGTFEPVVPVADQATRSALLKDASAKEKAYKALQQQFDEYSKQTAPAATAKGLSDYAQQEAQANGLSSAQAKTYYDENGDKLSAYQSAQLKTSLKGDVDAAKAMATGGARPDAWKDVPLTKGQVSRDDFINKIQSDDTYSDAEKSYLIGTVAPKFKTKDELKKKKK